MAARIGAVIRRVQQILQDAPGTRWGEPELLDWFNDGRRELAVLKPAEFSKRVAVPLAYGTMQSLPADAFQLMRVDCNLTTSSPRVPGTAVYPVDLRVLNAVHPGWQDTALFPFARDVVNYAYDPDEPAIFHVFPGNDGTGLVELTAAVLPEDAVAVDEPLGVRDVLLNAMVDYVLYRAFSKDADFSGNGERAASHYAMFASAIGVRRTSEGGA